MAGSLVGLVDIFPVAGKVFCTVLELVQQLASLIQRHHIGPEVLQAQQ
ncbi:hypothetical protein [Chitinimonas sp. BJB300]|nr:hypothetical protein [Chitinimonas sp. BJB300]